MIEDHHHTTLGPVSFGVALGIVSGTAVLLLGIVAAFFGWGVPLAAMLSSLYIGFGPTVAGSIAGAVWGFADGFVFGFLVAWLYNRLLRLRRPAGHKIAGHNIDRVSQ